MTWLARLDPFLEAGTFEEQPPVYVREPGIRGWYRWVFGVPELEASPVLQWMYGALLLGFYATFNRWITSDNITVETLARGSHRCWPYYPDCGDLYFLSELPDGYSQTTLYMVLFALMVGCVVAVWRRRWTLAHLLMMPLYVWAVLVMWVFTQEFTGNYHYFHLLYCTMFLLARSKLYFLRRAMVWTYLLAGTIKLDDGWMMATYFLNLKTGLPLFPDAVAPLVSHAIIPLEVGVALWLLSGNYLLQRFALVMFLFFHLYSGILVNYMYPTMGTGPLLVLFGVSIRRMRTPFSLRNGLGWAVLLFVTVTHSWSFFLTGDTRRTLEANKYGLYMFEANHQCVSTVTYHGKDGKVETKRDESRSARRRCDPFGYLFRMQQRHCGETSRYARLTWRFDHSINGGPFYRMVDEQDACGLQYDPLRHNAWIKGPEDGAPIVGYPVKNEYR